MFNQGQNKTSLIIVYDNKTEEYATFLQQLISQNDDSGEKIVGVRDGTVDATIWTTKVYEDSLAKITSNTHIIYIGSSKIAKNQGKNISFTFSKYGMNYGWLGKRAVLYVDTKKMLKKKEYDEFFALCKKYSEKFKKASVNFINSLPNAVKWIGVLCLPYFTWTVALYGLVSGNSNHKKIIDQQFRCLTMAFYMDGLRKFLEG
ncbi:MAG: hypothetical protein IJO28_04375 [Oscillospiraceae bacterium]|nr:hypothetical protein [Oscillospiraceae bacterium]